jgi:hypothetical protein
MFYLGLNFNIKIVEKQGTSSLANYLLTHQLLLGKQLQLTQNY